MKSSYPILSHKIDVVQTDIPIPNEVVIDNVSETRAGTGTTCGSISLPRLKASVSEIPIAPKIALDVEPSGVVQLEMSHLREAGFLP